MMEKKKILIKKLTRFLILLTLMFIQSCSSGWNENKRKEFISNCTNEAIKNEGVAKKVARIYCECMQQEVEKKYLYSSYIINEKEYIQDLKSDNTMLACNMVAQFSTKKEVEPEHIDQNPQNPRVDLKTAEEFKSTKHNFRIRRPKDWKNTLMEGQMVWRTAENNGDGPSNCFVKVSEDWSFGTFDNEDYIAGLDKEQLINTLKINYDKPIINVLDSYSLGGQEAAKFIYTGKINDQRMTTFILQTIRGKKLFTFGCASFSTDFPNRYLLFQRISDTFYFESSAH